MNVNGRCILPGKQLIAEYEIEGFALFNYRITTSALFNYRIITSALFNYRITTSALFNYRITTNPAAGADNYVYIISVLYCYAMSI